MVKKYSLKINVHPCVSQVDPVVIASDGVEMFREEVAVLCEDYIVILQLY